MVFKTVRLVNRRKHFVREFATHGIKSASSQPESPLTARSWKVMFFGTDDFSLGSLTRLNDEMKLNRTISKLEVVSSKWHLNPVRLFGQREGLVVHEWPVNRLTVQDFDVGLVASFGHLIPKQIIDAFPLGLLNVHGSLLPRWRGAAPVNYAIMHGDEVSGISIMRIQPFTFDKGEILGKREVPILPHETGIELRARLSDIGGEELLSYLRRLPQCLEDAQPQPEEGVCYAPKLTTDLGHIDFEKMTAECIYNRFRALYGTIPLVTSWMGLKLILHNVTLGIDDDHNKQKTENSSHVTCSNKSSVFMGSVSGHVQFQRKSKHLVVKCCDNSDLIVNQIAPLRKKSMSAIEFYNGYLSKQPKTSWIFR